MLAAIIVTYNRKELLCQNIEMLLKQTRKIDKIYIIDNCSTDGTYEMIKEKGWIQEEQFCYVKTVSNIGGAGGFYTGVKVAYEDGANWIILMDDDGRPCDEHAFDILVKHAEEMKETGISNNIFFINSLVVCGDRLTSKIGDLYYVKEAEEAAQNGRILGAAHPFNGTLISRELVEAIGYPNKDFFIKGDEVDYKQRTFDAGGYVVTLTDSKYYHPYVPTQEKVLLGKKVPVCVEAPWKEYYTARNLTFSYKKRRHYKMIAFELIFVKLYAIFTMPCKKIRTLRFMFKGLYHGWIGKLGPIVKP